MATKKHMNYDSDEAMTLRGSKIPKAIMASEGTRFDSAEDASVFFARELDHVKAQSYDVEYPELTALHLFPQSSEADPGAETITYYTYDKTGLAKIIDNYSTDLPRADVTGKPSFAKIKSIGDSYGYSAQEMRASRLAGKSLDARKGESARYQIDALTNKIAWCGDEESGLMGVLSDGQNIPLYPISIALELDADVQITYNPGAFITSAEAEELVRTMVQEAISGVGTAIIKDITIPHTGWTWQEENPDEQGAWDMDEYRYYVDVPVTEAAETQFPNVALHKAALETAKNAGLCPTVQTLAGALRFWAKRSPDEDMEATIALVSPGASSSGGGGGSTYVLPVATATRLGGVKIGKGISVAADGTITASTSGVSPDDMASTEDTESMLDEVFPSEDENP